MLSLAQEISSRIHKTVFLAVVSLGSRNWEKGCGELLFSTLDPFILFACFSN